MKFRLIYLVLCVFTLAALVFLPVDMATAQNPYVETLGSNTGFKGATSFTIGSSTATIMPTLPSGCHEAWFWSDVAFNYGGTTVSTNTYELNWASSTHLHPLVLDKFVTPNPTVYFRIRGTEAAAKTVYVRYR